MKKLKIAVMGAEHRHIFGQLKGMLDIGCECKGWWTEGENNISQDFFKKFPNIPRIFDKNILFNDPEISLILIADIPVKRASLAIECMKAGKDVMIDKPGCTTLEQLNNLKQTVKDTGKIWSINFSERFHVAAVMKAEELVADNNIGKVKQTIGTGPHRQGNYERPDWFYDRDSYGGIITDIGSHQIHQFLVFTNSNEAKVNHAMVENTTKKEFTGFQDLGEVNLTGNGGHGYVRLDWFTPDALPTWGDGRLFVLGDKGFIEIRKYTDLAKSEKGNQLFLANNDEVKHIDCSKVKLPYFANLIQDVLNRTDTSCSQELTYLSMELAIKAQKLAEKK